MGTSVEAIVSLYRYDKPVSLTFPHFKPSEIDVEETNTAGISSFQAATIFVTALTLAIVASLESFCSARKPLTSSTRKGGKPI